MSERLENGKKLDWGGLKIQRLKFDSISLTDESPVDKKNSILKKYIQNQMFIDSNSIKFYLRFNWIYGGLDCKKIGFKVNLGFYWKKLKF